MLDIWLYFVGAFYSIMLASVMMSKKWWKQSTKVEVWGFVILIVPLLTVILAIAGRRYGW